MGVCSLAIYEGAAELLLEKLDGPGERRLGDIASLGRPGEVELLAQGEEIPDLMHLHGGRQGSSFGVAATDMAEIGTQEKAPDIPICGLAA